jgi:hypothetical protein
MYLVYLGYTSFCENWWLLRFEAVSAYSLGGRAFELPPTPPAPLGFRYEWEINRDVLSRIVNGLYTNYDGLNLGVVTWAYWHAVAASPHIAGAHFGAALESLERAYLRTSGVKVSHLLVTEPTWGNIQNSLESYIAQANLDVEVTSILKNKIGGLNNAPQSIVASNILSSLGLIFERHENEAASLIRNKSAHGKDDEVDVEWIRSLKIVRIRFHRMLLAMTGASDWYYDYFTIGCPTRKLLDPIPE